MSEKENSKKHTINGTVAMKCFFGMVQVIHHVINDSLIHVCQWLFKLVQVVVELTEHILKGSKNSTLVFWSGFCA